MQPKNSLCRPFIWPSIWAVLLSALLLTSVAAGTGNSPLQTQHEVGIFGEVTDIASSFLGAVRITLDTKEGVRQILATPEDASVRVPGVEKASASDISPGDFLAILATRLADDSLEAVTILVKPDVPVVHAHITGAVLGAVGDQVRIMDGSGNVIAADSFLDNSFIDAAQVVTALVHQDLDTGSLSILGAESASVKIARLEGALRNADAAGAQQNRKNLGERLRSTTTGHLSTLQEILNRVDDDLISQALERNLQSHEALLASLDLGKPTLRLSGFVDEIDSIADIIFVSLVEGERVPLRVTGATTVREFGRTARLEQLLFDQIEAVYDPQTKEARSIDALFPTLPEELARSLLAQVRNGELEGRIGELNPSDIVVGLATGATVRLATDPQTRVVLRGEAARLADLTLGARVKVRYDPSSRAALEIETFDPVQNFISGVVKSVVRKFGERIPGSADDGNISIINLAGEAVTLDITQDTVIERDGMRTNIRNVNAGDLVRPTTRFSTDTRAVQKLALRSAGLRGTIRGKLTTPRPRDYLTISTDEFTLVTVAVTSTTKVIKGDDTGDFKSLTEGERLVSGLYKPLTLQASELTVGPPKTRRISGTISALAVDRVRLTVSPVGGEAVELLLPKSAPIILDGSPSLATDLNEGDKVQVAFYGRDRPVVVRIVVTSR